MATPYRDIPYKLEGLEGFGGFSLSAVNTGRDSGEMYLVSSYSTVIGRVGRSAETGRIVHAVTDANITPTTSRGQNLCREHLPGSAVAWADFDREIAGVPA
jgi:hypothetical protein